MSNRAMRRAKRRRQDAEMAATFMDLAADPPSWIALQCIEIEGRWVAPTQGDLDLWAEPWPTLTSPDGWVVVHSHPSGSGSTDRVLCPDEGAARALVGLYWAGMDILD